jgi:hypothetical protein
MQGLRVYDSDKTTPLYEVELGWKKLEMKIRSTATNNEIGTAEYHFVKTRIDTTVHGTPIRLSSQHWNREYTYDSPAFIGAKLTWKPQRKLDELDMVLLDEKAMPIARFMPANWAMKKGGKLEILSQSVGGQEVMDEVVVSTLAVMYYRHVQRGAAGSAVPGAAG